MRNQKVQDNMLDPNIPLMIDGPNILHTNQGKPTTAIQHALPFTE